MRTKPVSKYASGEAKMRRTEDEAEEKGIEELGDREGTERVRL